MESISVVTISDRELANHLEAATERLFSFKFRETSASEQPESPSVTMGGRRIAYRPLQNAYSGASGSRAAKEFSLAQAIQDIDPKDDLYTDVEHHIVRILRRGIQLFHYINDAYSQASGLERLRAANKSGELSTSREPELIQKVETGAAVALFAMARYISARLAGYRADEVQELTLEIDPPTEIDLKRRKEALDSVLYYLHQAIKGHARDDISLIKIVLMATRAVAERIHTMRESFQHLEFYTRYHYRVEPEEIALRGFEMEDEPLGLEIEMVQKRPEEVVGNHIAKFEAMRLSQRLICYDLERQRNPFVDLGGFTFTFIGDGNPGTGKTTLIQMMVSLITEYCKILEIPFRYANFSVDEISDYQGRSGQNAKRFCKSVMDPRVIGFGTIDDVDQVCANRNDKNASAGQLEVTAVFMQEFAGPATIIRGNSSFGLFSNYPEKVDDALRQRTQSRFTVDGPQTLEDFTDLFYLLLNQNLDLPKGGAYDPFTTQQIQTVIRAKYAEHSRPQSPALAKLFDRITADSSLSTWVDFGNYLFELQKHDARFTGRAVKNIADAVRFRMMDFDLPPEWFEDPRQFFGKPYETRIEMLNELKGTITPEMVIQEINRYADSEERYAHEASRREFESRTDQVILEARARVEAQSRLETSRLETREEP